MVSLAQRFTLVIALAAALPLLGAVLPGLWRSGGGAPATALLVIGSALVIVGVVGAVAWTVTRVLLRPLVDLIDMLNPTTAAARGAPQDVPQNLPLEIRLLRAVVFGRDAARRRQADERATYVTTLIHDMKTPLLAVSRSLDMAIDDADEMRRRSRLSATNDEVRRLLGLVQDVVDSERLASGALQLRWQAVDLLDLVRRVAERVQPMRRAIAVQVTGRSLQPHRGDPELLERAVENVLANALHHARSHVSISVLPGLVRVSDDGPGISADFESAGLAAPARAAQRPMAAAGGIRGSALPAAAGSGSGGAADPGATERPAVTPSARRSSGLGLFIAKRVAEAHGGRIVLESTGEFGTTLLLYIGSQDVPEANHAARRR